MTRSLRDQGYLGQSETSPAATATDGLGSDLSETRGCRCPRLAIAFIRIGCATLSSRDRIKCGRATSRISASARVSFIWLLSWIGSAVTYSVGKYQRVWMQDSAVPLWGSRLAARPPGNLQYPDQGAQFTSEAFTSRLEAENILISMGRPRPRVGQCLCRTSVENSQIRGRVPEGLLRSSRRGAGISDPTFAFTTHSGHIRRWPIKPRGSGVPQFRDNDKDAALRPLLLISFKGMRKSIRTMETSTNAADVSAHLSDEFPASYSLTRCSPAELVSASPAGIDDASAQVPSQGIL